MYKYLPILRNGYLIEKWLPIFIEKWLPICWEMVTYLLRNGYLFVEKWLPICGEMATYLLRNGYLFVEKWLPNPYIEKMLTVLRKGYLIQKLLAIG